MRKLRTSLALAAFFLSLNTYAETSLVVTGPTSIEAGDDFTIFYTISWEAGDILPDNPVIGVSSTLMEFPAFIGTEMRIEGSNTTPNNPGWEIGFEENGYVTNGSHQWQAYDTSWEGTSEPINLIVAQHFSTTEALQDGTYRFTIDTDPNKTFIYFNDQTNLGFDHVQEFYLNVGPQVPEPATYAAAVGVLTLLATALIRRRRAREF